MMCRLQKQTGRITPWLTAFLAFALPLSTSAVSVLGILILLCWFLEGNFRAKFVEIAENRVSLAVLAYVALFALGLLWSTNLTYGVHTLIKEWKLLMIPVFLTIVRPERRRFYLNFFIAGMTVAMVMTYGAWFDIIHYRGVSPEHVTRGTFHVVYNPMLAIAVYIVFHEAAWGGLQRLSQWGLLLLGCVMVLNMFITEGRTGQMAFFVLMILFLAQYFQRNRARSFVLILLLVPSLFALGYTFSPIFHHRIDRAIVEIREVKDHPQTSVGMRIVVAENTWRMIRDNWLFGVGTGDFPQVYAEVNKKISPNVVSFDDPHNQYLFAWSRFGLPGLFILLGLLMVQIGEARRMTHRYRRLCFAVPVFYGTIMWTTSYLTTFETGFLFSFLSAVLFKHDQAVADSVCSPLQSSIKSGEECAGHFYYHDV